MPDSYPYIVSNNKIAPIFTRLRSACVSKMSRFMTRSHNIPLPFNETP
jgi:hypothetical protein